MLRRFVTLDRGGPLLPVLYIDDETGVIYRNGIPELTLQSFPLTPINTGGSGGVVTALYSVPSSSTPTFDFTPETNGIRQSNILVTDIMPTFTGSTAGDVVVVMLTQDSTGGYSVSWPSNVNPETPQPSGAANSSTLYQWMFDGSEYKLMSATGGQ